MIKNLKTMPLLLLIVSVFYGATATAEIAIIVNPSVKIDYVSIHKLKMLYLGKTRIIQGEILKPLDQKTGSSARTEFYELAIQEDDTFIKQYWARRMFAGKGNPPKEYEDDEAIKERVVKNARSLGYINKSAVDDTVKVILTLP